LGTEKEIFLIIVN